MTLSARIAIDPSRRLERLAAGLSAAGVVVAATTLALRWPQAWFLLLVGAAIACAAIFAAARRRRAQRRVLTVSHLPEFAVQPDPAGTEGSWRLAESTLVWSGFSILAIGPSDPSTRRRALHIPVFADELTVIDRRALYRFLLWSLQGGGTVSRPPRL